MYICEGGSREDLTLTDRVHRLRSPWSTVWKLETEQSQRLLPHWAGEKGYPVSDRWLAKGGLLLPQSDARIISRVFRKDIYFTESMVSSAGLLWRHPRRHKTHSLGARYRQPLAIWFGNGFMDIMTKSRVLRRHLNCILLQPSTSLLQRTLPRRDKGNLRGGRKRFQTTQLMKSLH